MSRYLQESLRTIPFDERRLSLPGNLELSRDIGESIVFQCDPRYIGGQLENINWTPLSLEEVIGMIVNQMGFLNYVKTYPESSIDQLPVLIIPKDTAIGLIEEAGMNLGHQKLELVTDAERYFEVPFAGWFMLPSAWRISVDQADEGIANVETILDDQGDLAGYGFRGMIDLYLAGKPGFRTKVDYHCRYLDRNSLVYMAENEVDYYSHHWYK